MSNRENTEDTEIYPPEADSPYPPKAGDNRRFTKPESENANNQYNQALTESPENVLASCLALLAEKHPDLALVVERWPDLPDAVK